MVDFGSRTPSGEPVVVEMFYPADLLGDLASQERDRFRPLLLLGLGLLVIAQLPLTIALSHRRKALAAQHEATRSTFRHDQRQRTTPNRRRSPRRPGAGSHRHCDGTVCGHRVRLPRRSTPTSADLAGEARSTVRSLRSLLNNIYPVDVPA